MQVGDIVAYDSSQHILHCGSSIYSDAVVVQEAPLVLVSRSSDMRWQSTVVSDKLKIVGKADDATLERCMRRLEN